MLASDPGGGGGGGLPPGQNEGPSGGAGKVGRAGGSKFPKNPNVDPEPGIAIGAYGGHEPSSLSPTEIRRLQENLPVWKKKGDKAYGFLLMNDTQTTLRSGKDGPAKDVPLGTRGFNGLVRTHVEGHAVAVMREAGTANAVLVINKKPCPGANGCDAMLPRMLSPGATLTVIYPGGRQVYTGLIPHTQN